MRRKALRFEIMTMENTVSKLRFSRRIDFNDCRDSLQLFCDGINLDRFSKNCTSLRESESETARKARVRKTEAATATQWERSERVREEAREISQRAETPEIEWVREREIKRETQCGLSRAGTSVETWFCFKKFFFHACSQGIGEATSAQWLSGRTLKESRNWMTTKQCEEIGIRENEHMNTNTSKWEAASSKSGFLWFLLRWPFFFFA